MITRRGLAIPLAAAALAPFASWGQARRRFRIGSVYVAKEVSTLPYEEAFLNGLRDLGYERGRNLVYDVRHADGDPTRVPSLVDEVLAAKPDLLVGIEQVAVVMRSKTTSVPILLTISSDPIAAGLARTMARPGGNVTGIASLFDALAVKHIQILHEIVPGMRKVAILLDPGLPATYERNVHAAANTLRAQAVFHRAKDRPELEAAFARMESDRPDAIVSASGTGSHFGERQFIADTALRLRLPCSGVFAANAEAGSLFSYGASLHGMFSQAAAHAARIFKGAAPADLPIEQPTRYELVLNLRTAKVLGLKLQQSVLLGADQTIE
jgi:putative ABC transport system substrate-binding protein